MWCGVVTIFPDMFKLVTEFGVTGRAVQGGLLDLRLCSPRDFATDVHRTVDDRPYGGGPGMVMKVEPLRKAIRQLRAEVSPAVPLVIALSPQGKKITQQDLRRVSAEYEHIIFVAGRYEGIDERLYQLEVDEQWSVGDYVLSGGELPAMVAIDGITRLLPGVLGNVASAQQDSFMAGMLDFPHYTRPEEIDGLRVPEVLLSGNHVQIAKWRKEQQLERTKKLRPDLLNTNLFEIEEQKYDD